jgi:hypothetical protein
MTDDLEKTILERLNALEAKIAHLDLKIDRVAHAYSIVRHGNRRVWLRPPIWTFEQHSPQQLAVSPAYENKALPDRIPSIGIVTPSYNQRRYLEATINSVLAQDYPKLSYIVQDGGSNDGTVDLLRSYGDRVKWHSGKDDGQAHAINLGFAGIDSDIMAYLNSDDVLLPGTLAYVARYFQSHPDIDVVYGHRIFINSDGMEIGRAVLPGHDAKAIKWVFYIPQETLFWRRRVWDKIRPFDASLTYAIDWDFVLRAQAAGFKLARLPRFLACFRVHDQQKTATIYDIGRQEMQMLRRRVLGFEPTQGQILRAALPYLVRQLIYHWSYKLGVLKY